MTGRVQFREDEDTIAFLESLGLNPNDVARTAFETEVRRLRAKAKFDKLRSLNLRLDGSTAKWVREDRESH